MCAISYIENFGLNLFLTKALRRITLHSNSTISWWINKQNETLIEQKLMDITKRAEIEDNDIILKERPEKESLIDPIWVMWYQGIKNAPDIVKSCVSSIKSNANGHEVIILTEKNLSEYIELPSFIWKKFHKGIISRTHLSDMIRLNVLYIYGGAWIDATVLCTDKIPQEYFNEEVFSINFENKTKDPSHGRWTTFCFFAKRHNLLVKETLELHYKYWFTQRSVIDYVMFDYFISYLVKTNKDYEKMINDIKPSNKGVFSLVKKMNNVSQQLIPLDENTLFYKLSWKRNYIKKVNDKRTVYCEVIEKYKLYEK